MTRLGGGSIVSKVLRAGGTIARFWTYDIVEEPLGAPLDAVYREQAADAFAHARERVHREHAPAETPQAAVAARFERAFERRPRQAGGEPRNGMEGRGA